MRKPTVAIVLVVVLGVLGAACGKSSSHTAAPSANTAPSTTAATAPREAGAALAPTGTLRLAVVASPPLLAHRSPPAGIPCALATSLAARLRRPPGPTVH